VTTAYDELEQAWKRELHSSELQSMRQGLFKDLAAYVRRMRESHLNVDAKSLKAIIMEEETVRIEQLLSQLLDWRIEKIWSQTKLVQSNSLESTEKNAYESFAAISRDYERLKQDIIQGREPSISKPMDRDSGLVLIRFVRDVPSIIGVDLKAHGPFHKEDIANLPRENAESLIRQGSATEIRTSSQDNG
jgi:DNA replication initiation complex subunit (GINS family)